MRRLVLLVVAPVLGASACAPRLYSADADLPDVTLPDGSAWEAPENGWPSAAPPETLVGQGFAEGQVVLDVRGVDQHGDEVSLWQFYGKHVLVDISTMWCSPCRDLGIHTEETWQRFKEHDFIYLTVLHEDIENEPPDAADLDAWAGLAALGDGGHERITSPIIADPKGANGSIGAILNNFYPALLLVDPELKVVDRIEPVTPERVDEVLAEVLE